MSFPSPRDLPNPGIKPMSPSLAGGFFITEPLQKSSYLQFSSLQSLSRVQLFVTPWIAAGQASLSVIISSVDYEGYSISSKGWLPTVVVDIMVI